MKIISHRGYWKLIEERNSKVAFQRSFELGFGTETDIRDYNGQLVISHDIPDSIALTLNDFFQLYSKYSNLTLALNIKSDGLQNKLIEQLNAFGINEYFVFDMSIPDTLGYNKYGINFFSRQSEYEPFPAFYEHCNGIWIDSFVSQWYTASLIKEHLNKGKKVSIVSPELHKREHLSFWQYLKENDIQTQNNILLCTDYPEDAKKFFNYNK